MMLNLDINTAFLFATLAVAGAPAGVEAACAKAAGAPDWFNGAECAPCPAQPWYPCNRADLCACGGGGGGGGGVPAPAPSPVPAAGRTCARAAGAPGWLTAEYCAPCETQAAYWTCNRADLCTCSGSGGPPPPPPPPAPGPGGGTCGGGQRGNGACADGNLCCSPYGYCGTSSAHCADSPPPPPPPPTRRPTPPPHHQSPHGPPPPASGGGSCGNGSRGDGVCPNGLCCSEYGWCGSTASHCAGNPLPPAPTPPSPPPPPTGGGAQAYVTYHNYFAGQPLTQVSCSDGQTGLMTRWGYSTIDPMAPYVAATSISGWNSPNCGKCFQVVGTAGTVYLTAIDQCVPGPGGGMHFDIHPTAFRELMGDAGVTAGVGYAEFQEVASSNCRGNKG